MTPTEWAEVRAMLSPEPVTDSPDSPLRSWLKSEQLFDGHPPLYYKRSGAK